MISLLYFHKNIQGSFLRYINANLPLRRHADICLPRFLNIQHPKTPTTRQTPSTPASIPIVRWSLFSFDSGGGVILFGSRDIDGNSVIGLSLLDGHKWGLGEFRWMPQNWMEEKRLLRKNSLYLKIFKFFPVLPSIIFHKFDSMYCVGTRYPFHSSTMYVWLRSSISGKD